MNVGESEGSKGGTFVATGGRRKGGERKRVMVTVPHNIERGVVWICWTKV